MKVVQERWRKVVGFPDYSVSDHGRVRRDTANCGTHPGRISKLQLSHGYPRVYLYNSYKHIREFKKVHHLVLYAFCGARSKGQIARHLNGCRNDNYYKNLCWGTILENTLDSMRHGTYYNGFAHIQTWSIARRKKFYKKCADIRNSRPEEEKRKTAMKLSVATRRTYNNYTPEQKRLRILPMIRANKKMRLERQKNESSTKK